MPLDIAKVAVDSASYGFDKAYDYRIPEHLLEAAKPGCRVAVQFGVRRRQSVGLILEVCGESSSEKIKPLLAVLDEAPLLNNEMLSLIAWLKNRTFCTLFEAAKALLPSGINYKTVVSYTALPDAGDKKAANLTEDEQRVYEYLLNKPGFTKRDTLLNANGLKNDSPLPEQLVRKGLVTDNYNQVKRIGDQTVRMVRLTELFGEESDNFPKLTPKQRNIVDLLTDTGTASVKEICYFTGLTPSVISALEKKGVVEIYENTVCRRPAGERAESGEKKAIALTEEQQRAFDSLLNQYRIQKGGVSLLYGVTGSGKTQVYMRMIDEVEQQGKGVIVMVPEIALTPQTIALFEERYGDKIAVFHSALSVGERADEWKRVKNGNAKIAVGTRSAVFAPFDTLGLIIIDEEQEHTYKSEKTPRYNAKDISRFRCAKHNALLILASATPSVESYAAAKSGKYTLNVLKNRYGSAILPEVVTVDMCEEIRNGNKSAISSVLLTNLKQNLAAGGQAILLINRRGYNTFAACVSCGHVVACPHCSISMTFHSANSRLMCHYCGYSRPFTDVCPACEKKDIRYSGFGTQKIEDEVAKLLPEARVLRMDTDTTMSRFSYSKRFEQFANGDYDILLGTQMVAKGLDFESVTLAGVISVDQQLHNDDYRSLETTFALLTQVVGRSGRGRLRGKAIIQTLTPENEIIQYAQKQDYEAFYKNEIQIRKLLVYPPFCDICLIGFSGEEENKVKAAAAFVFEQLKELTAKKYSSQKIIVLGPLPARLLKMNNKFRHRIIIKCRNTNTFRELISELLIVFRNKNTFGGVSAYADMNPDSIL